MTPKPIEQLLEEHKVILAQVDQMQQAAEQLENGGEASVAAALPVFSRFGEMTRTRLDLHRRKEDDVLFPVIEEAFDGLEAPTGPMREQHKEIHAQGAVFRQTLQELNEVQHPAIEAGSEELRNLVENGGSAGALRRVALYLADLLHDHFRKEEQMLFPMARQVLEREQWDRVQAGFERLEAEE